MSDPLDRLKKAVEAVRSWLAHSPNPGEAVVRQAIVLRFLDAAGFDIWNPLEVVPEETNVTGNRADFLIRRGDGKFALELKGMNVTLSQSHYQQAATYAVNEGTRWAIVTNGRVWVVIDEHLPGKWDERVALKLELGQEADTFADDLALLLNVKAWSDDMFVAALDQIKDRQNWRHDAQRTKREKTPVVEAIQQKYKIPSFDLAIDNAIEMHRITEAEGDILRGTTMAWEPYIDVLSLGSDDLKKGVATGQSHRPEKTQVSEKIEFTFNPRKAKATVVWNPANNTWTIKKGSTGLDRVPNYGKWLETEREKLILAGILKRIDGGLLEYIQDHEYTSPSNAAFYIAGRSCSGWDCWKDESGQPANTYRRKE